MITVIFMKRFYAILAAALVFALLPTVAAAVPLVTVETQYNYITSNPAWLKNLIVNEDMTSPTGMLNNLVLQAQPEYPYAKTPDSFRNEVDYYVELFSLNENSPRAAYIYVLDYVNKFASEATKNVSDESIKEYLTSIGILYPAGGLGDYENLIFARAVYTLLASGAVTLNNPQGLTVQQALVRCMTDRFNINADALATWSGGSVDTLDDYVLVACKIALNGAGYRVTATTPAQEVYRLTAVMMIKQLGISIDENNASFDELKLKYLCALLGSHYDISLDPEDLRAALANGSVPLYLLQVIGRQGGVTVRGSMMYSEPFILVARNTDYFDLEEGEFYADIYKYATYLRYKRNRIWICPETYRTPTATENVFVTVNGISGASGKYTEVLLNMDEPSQVIDVTVIYQSSSQSESKTYHLTVYQGTATAPAADSSGLLPSGTSGGNSLINIAGNNLANTLGAALTAAGTKVPARVETILSLMTPAVNNNGASAATPQNTTGADYLSQLMTAGGGTVGQSVNYPLYSGNTNATGSSLGVYTAGNNGTDFSSGAAVQNNSLFAGTPMRLSEAADPPEGYEYSVNADGYITGISLKRTTANTGNVQKTRQTVDPRSRRLLYAGVAAGAAMVCLGILGVIQLRRKKKI